MKFDVNFGKLVLGVTFKRLTPVTKFQVLSNNSLRCIIGLIVKKVTNKFGPETPKRKLRKEDFKILKKRLTSEGYPNQGINTRYLFSIN